MKRTQQKRIAKKLNKRLFDMEQHFNKIYIDKDYAKICLQDEANILQSKYQNFVVDENFKSKFQRFEKIALLPKFYYKKHNKQQKKAVATFERNNPQAKILIEKYGIS